MADDATSGIANMEEDNNETAQKDKVKPLSPKEIVRRLDQSNRQKFLFEYEKRARDQSTKWQSIWEAHLLVLTILRGIPSVPTLSPYPFVAVSRWEPAKEMILGEGEGEFKLVLCDEVGAHFCVVTSRIVNAEFYTEKNRQIYAVLQRELLESKVLYSRSIVNSRLKRIEWSLWKNIPGQRVGRLPWEYRMNTPLLPLHTRLLANIIFCFDNDSFRLRMPRDSRRPGDRSSRKALK
jgi:hypothetical protein